MYTRLRSALVLIAALAWTQSILQASPESWVEVNSPHYTAISNAGEAEARAALRQFEAIREVFRTLLPAARLDTGRPLTLLVLQDEEAMRRVLPQQFEGADPSRPSGFFLQSQDQDFAILRLDVNQAAEQPYFTLYHEFIHAIVHANLKNVPVWLDEGLADFYGATEIRKDRVLIGLAPPVRLGHLRNSPLLPAETFFTVDHDSPHYTEGGKTSIFYAQSWAAVHYLFMEPSAQGQLGKLFKALEGGGGSLQVHRRGLGDLQGFIRALGAYAKRTTFRHWDYGVAMQATDADFRSRPLDPAEALVVRAEFLQRLPRPEQALQLLKEALEHDPGLPRAHLALGFQHYQAKADEPAKAHFQRALAGGLRDFRLHHYLGALALRGTDPKGPREAVVQLERACALNPAYAPAHSLLGLACLAHGEDGASRALAATRRAVELEPASLAFRANYGSVCMVLEMESQARSVGEDLNALARTPQERDLAADFALRLARFLEQRRPPVEPAAQSPFGSVEARRSLKFRLPEKYQDLGKAVLARVAEGREKEAIALVQGALAKATAAEDRKSLKSLIGQLQGATGTTK